MVVRARGFGAWWVARRGTGRLRMATSLQDDMRLLLEAASEQQSPGAVRTRAHRLPTRPPPPHGPSSSLSPPPCGARRLRPSSSGLGRISSLISPWVWVCRPSSARDRQPLHTPGQGPRLQRELEEHPRGKVGSGTTQPVRARRRRPGRWGRRRLWSSYEQVRTWRARGRCLPRRPHSVV